MSEQSDRPLFDDFVCWIPPHEQGSLLGASGGAAQPTSANGPRQANAGLPWHNRRCERVWFGRVERIPGAE
jgi:hypothetical protein